jgi:hypothetical protein
MQVKEKTMTEQIDKKDYNEKIKLLDKYQIGDTYYYIHDNKIKSGEIKEILFNSYIGPFSSLSTKFEIVVSNSGASNIRFTPEKLFDTQKDAIEQFLKDSDVPSELLRDIVLPDEMVFKLKGKEYSKIFIKEAPIETDSNYWDCECERYYIHSINHDVCPVCKARRENAPPSRIGEIKDNRYSLRNKHD